MMSTSVLFRLLAGVFLLLALIEHTGRKDESAKYNMLWAIALAVMATW